MFTGVTWGVTAAELLDGAIEFIMVFKEFLLLGVVILFAPKIVNFFKGIIGRRQSS